MRCDGLVAEVQDWAAGLEEVHARIAGRFARAEPRARVLTYLRGLLGQLERKNGWTLAEAAGEVSPDGCSDCCAPRTGMPRRFATSFVATWLSASAPVAC